MQNKWFVEAAVVHHGSSLTTFTMKQFAPLWKPLQKPIQRSQNHQWFHPMVYVRVDVAEVTSISARRSLRSDLNLAIRNGPVRVKVNVLFISYGGAGVFLHLSWLHGGVIACYLPDMGELKGELSEWFLANFSMDCDFCMLLYLTFKSLLQTM